MPELPETRGVVEVHHAAVHPPKQSGHDYADEHDVARPPLALRSAQWVLGQAEGACDLVEPPDYRPQRSGDVAGDVGLAQDVEHVAFGLLSGFGRLDPELLGVSHQRAPEEDVHPDDKDDHDRDPDADLAQVALVHRRLHVRADPRQRVGLAYADGLGGGQEEPAAPEAHHPVPDHPDHRAGHVQAPEPFPFGQAEHAGRFV